MKIKIIAEEPNYTKYKEMLEKGGFTIDVNATLVLKEEELSDSFLAEQDDKIVSIPYDDVLYIESYGRYVFINTCEGFYRLKNRLYEVEETLKGLDFIRISKSVIVYKKGIESIMPIINGRFDLTMKNKETITVTKSYRSSFKRFIGF